MTGKISTKLEKIYRVVLKAQLRGIKAIRPGAKGCDVDKAARSVIEKAGYGKRFGHGLGHGIGLEIHEEPVLTGSVPSPVPLDGPIHFRPGAVVSSEWFSSLWTIEEPFVMTENGWQPLVDLRGLTDPAG